MLTDGHTDGRTDKPFYRDARTHLKTWPCMDPLLDATVCPAVAIWGSGLTSSSITQRLFPVGKEEIGPKTTSVFQVSALDHCLAFQRLLEHSFLLLF